MCARLAPPLRRARNRRSRYEYPPADRPGRGEAELVTRADLLDYFHRGGKPPADWRVVAEFEWFVVERATGRALSNDEPGRIRDILEGLVARFGWEPHARGERLTLLARAGATVSLEPGGQVEYSSPLEWWSSRLV